jgi:hypothetical protein
LTHLSVEFCSEWSCGRAGRRIRRTPCKTKGRSCWWSCYCRETRRVTDIVVISRPPRTRINLQAKTLDINNLDDINSSGWENVEVTSYGHDRIYFTASHVKMPMSIKKKFWPYTKDMKMVIFWRPQVSWQF